MFSHLYVKIDCGYSCLFDKIAEELIRAKKKALHRTKDKLAKPIYWNKRFHSKAAQLIESEEYIISYYTWRLFNAVYFLFEEIEKVDKNGSWMESDFTKRYLSKLSELKAHFDEDEIKEEIVRLVLIIISDEENVEMDE